MAKQKKRMGRPYKLTMKQHEELIRRKRAGENAGDLAYRYKLQLHTIYQYLNLDPAERTDQ